MNRSSNLRNWLSSSIIPSRENLGRAMRAADLFIRVMFIMGRKSRNESSRGDL